MKNRLCFTWTSFIILYVSTTLKYGTAMRPPIPRRKMYRDKNSLFQLHPKFPPHGVSSMGDSNPFPYPEGRFGSEKQSFNSWPGPPNLYQRNPKDKIFFDYNRNKFDRNQEFKAFPSHELELFLDYVYDHVNDIEDKPLPPRPKSKPRNKRNIINNWLKSKSSDQKKSKQKLNKEDSSSHGFIKSSRKKRSWDEANSQRAKKKRANIRKRSLSLSFPEKRKRIKRQKPNWAQNFDQEYEEIPDYNQMDLNENSKYRKFSGGKINNFQLKYAQKNAEIPKISEEQDSEEENWPEPQNFNQYEDESSLDEDENSEEELNQEFEDDNSLLEQNSAQQLGNENEEDPPEYQYLDQEDEGSFADDDQENENFNQEFEEYEPAEQSEEETNELAQDDMDNMENLQSNQDYSREDLNNENEDANNQLMFRNFDQNYKQDNYFSNYDGEGFADGV